ncbi:hypothetical protein [Clostridium sp. JN-9]|uniref:hypothetical protein n=1 Tax=Clostridium sp. JN-9 TaxID=2507159 RepID=UPI000FFE2945|nr:hypothetical protein [Clostridium sp. JN-9]QAT40841.1 hypothetical protein EQM05_11525 [Clostridium sp. JN-9]
MDATVKFIKNYSPYAKGDIAGFDNNQADWFERAGVVEKVGDGVKNVSDNGRKGKKLPTNK